MGWTDSALLGCLCSSSNKEQASSGDKRGDGVAPIIAADVPELTLRELKKATAKFSPSRLVGRGDRGEVFRATLPGGRTAAAKRLRLPPPRSVTDEDRAADVERLRKHVSVASRLRHENVVRLLGYKITADLRVLLYEFADVGTLHDVLHGPRAGTPEKPAGSGPPAVSRLSWEQRARIALDAARGLAYLHEAAVEHKGVRSTNVLLFEGLRAKIADHDVPAPPVAEDKTMLLERRGCLPPENMSANGATRKSDVFSFGEVLLELLTGREPFNNALPWDEKILVHWAIPLLEEGKVEECIDPKLGGQYPPAGALKLGRIAVQCLQERPTSRPSMDTVARLIDCDVIMKHQHGVV